MIGRKNSSHRCRFFDPETRRAVATEAPSDQDLDAAVYSRPRYPARLGISAQER